MSQILAEFRIAFRSLLRRPALTVLAIGTLTLGVAAVAAVFSVVDAVLLKPFTFRQPDRLVAVWEVQRSQGDELWRVAPATYVDWSRERSVFEQLAAFSTYGATLTGRGEPRAIRGARITPNYFETLGSVPLHGRTLRSGDSASDHLVVLGHGLWRERFGARPEVVGELIELDGTAFTVVGVMPPGSYPSWPVNGPRIQFQSEYHDLWVLLPSETLAIRTSHILGVVGRLAPGVELESARSAMDQVARRLAATHPGTEDEGVLVRPFAEEAVGDVRPALGLLLGAAAMVLIVACANVGGLVAARAAERRGELAIRRSLGAGNLPLARQFFAEGLLLCSAGAAAGTALAALALDPLKHLVPRQIPRLADAGVDLRAIAVAAGIALVSSLVFSLVPLLLPAQSDLAEALRDGNRSGVGRSRQRLRTGLTATQVALAVALTITAALLVESYRRLERAATGISAGRVLIADLDLPSARYPDRSAVERFYRALIDAARAAPGVEAAHVAYDHPFESHWLDAFKLPGREQRNDLSWVSELVFVSPGHFANLGIPIVAGREFTDRDTANGRGVAIVNRAFVRRFLGGEEAVGATLTSSVGTWSWGDDVPVRFEIVGVVEDVRRPGFEDAVEPAYYLDAWQIPQLQMKLIATTSGEPGAAVSAIREGLRQLDRDLPIGKFRTLEVERRRAVAQPKFTMQLMSLFGGLALTLATIGVYGLLGAWVAGQRREIGIRLSLGADRSAVAGLVLRRGLKIASIGAAAGAGAALVVSRLLASQLYAVSATDPGVFLVAPLVVLTAAFAAGWIPAWKAARVDPAVSLREE